MTGRRVRSRRLEQALAGLDERTREVFLMSSRDRLSYAEIAARLNISAEAVERHMADALHELDKRLTQTERPSWRFWR
ncbi:sigma-70 family RNA polymerase sigma factor [Sphingosinicella sp. CPCC 101087]|uniref:sigma-70 family RNA polymerase sigma factor n=1 Tax=Sphingosinicella sp. CPCC 101087 TaxID=2497754 RepID=UPI00101BB772|nr:sigma-70 family RNA polymerase sigma factor [Sphingosinicella sp. CPCC 101087]